MDTTASINFAKTNVKWSKLKFHNKRKYKKMGHDVNKNINLNFSKFNEYDHNDLPTYDELMIPLIDKNKLKAKHNKYLKNSQKKYARRYKSVKAYLKSKRHKNCRCAIITLGNAEFRDKFEANLMKQGVSRGQCRIIERNAMINYTHGFNKRHEQLKIIHYAEHGDETFDHEHTEMAGIPTRTKSGKMSFNFIKALKEEVSVPSDYRNHKLHLNNRIALKRLRTEEDPMIVASLNGATKAFIHNHDMKHITPPTMKLVRNGLATPDNEHQHSLAVSYADKATSNKAKNSTIINDFKKAGSEYASSVVSKYSGMASKLSSSASSEIKIAKNSYSVSASQSTANFNKFENSYYQDTDRKFSDFNAQFSPQQMNSLNNQYPITTNSLALGSLGNANYKNSVINDYKSKSISSAEESISAAKQRHKNNIAEYHRFMYQNFRLFGIGQSTSRLYAKNPKAMTYLINELDYHIQNQKNLSSVKEVENNVTDYEKNKSSYTPNNSEKKPTQPSSSANYETRGFDDDDPGF